MKISGGSFEVQVELFCDENPGPTPFSGRLLEARGFGENRGVRCWSEVLGVRWPRPVGAPGRSAALAMDLRRGGRLLGEDTLDNTLRAGA